jgi:hypothetical protein
VSEEHDEAAWVAERDLASIDLIPVLRPFAEARARSASEE